MSRPTHRLGAISLLVHDYDAAIAFYVGKLGFDLSEDTDMGGGKRWVRVTPKGGETSLLLARESTLAVTAINEEMDHRKVRRKAPPSTG